MFPRGPASQTGYQREREVTGQESNIQHHDPYSIMETHQHHDPLSLVNFLTKTMNPGMVGGSGQNGTDESDELMRKLRAL